MKEIIIKLLNKAGISREIAENNLEIPKESSLGDIAFPCFVLAKTMKKSPVMIAQELSNKISCPSSVEKIEAKGPYLNFYFNIEIFTQKLLNKINLQKDKFGSSSYGKGKKVVIEFSSPNIAKQFGIGHLRSTVIGNSLANIYKFLGYKVIRINYLGDWGTPLGKVIAGFKHFGNYFSLEKSSLAHLNEIYVKANQNKNLEQEAKDWFKKMENRDNEALKLWRRFKSLSLKNLNQLYKRLAVNFDVISGESFYEKDIPLIIEQLKKKNLIQESEGALIIDLKKYNLGICLIQKSDGTKLYATRDIAAAIDRHNKYSPIELIYEVGAEQKLHFSQVFKTLDLMGYGWSKNCIHIDHGLYLDKDGKKLATRKGKTIFMDDILNETESLAKDELKKRYPSLQKKDLDNRAKKISRAAIFYGDLKNYRTHDIVFHIQRFISFEGDTGPYLLYTYARAKSILRKAKYNPKRKISLISFTGNEKQLSKILANFPGVVEQAQKQKAPNLIANYTFQLAQLFNEFYHSNKVIGAKEEQFRLNLVAAISQVLKNSLRLLGIEVLEKM